MGVPSGPTTAQLERLFVRRLRSNRHRRIVRGRLRAGKGSVTAAAKLRQRHGCDEEERPERPPARRGPDRSFGVQQAANPQETRGSRVQTENAERFFESPAVTISVPKNPQKRLPGFNPGCLADRHGEIIARILAQAVNDPIRGPDDRIEKVQDGLAARCNPTTTRSNRRM